MKIENYSQMNIFLLIPLLQSETRRRVSILLTDDMAHCQVWAWLYVTSKTHSIHNTREKYIKQQTEMCITPDRNVYIYIYRVPQSISLITPDFSKSIKGGKDY